MQILNFTASFTASFNQFAGSFQYIWFLTMAKKTIFSDCLDKINTVAKTLKPLLYLSLKQKKRVTISDYSCSSGNWIHCFTLFRNGPKKKTAQRNSDCFAI